MNQEHNIQAAAVRAFRLIFAEYAYMLVNIPNGAKRTRYEAAIAKSEGMTAGAPDLVLLVPRNGYGHLGIEFKTTSKSSKQRVSQVLWQQESERCGNKYVVVRSVDEFFEEVSAYLGVDNPLQTNSARKQLQTIIKK